MNVPETLRSVRTLKILKSIKFRLTLWYMGAIAVVLIVFGALAYTLLSKNLYKSLDESLRARVIELQSSIKIEGERIIFDQKVNELVMIYNADGRLVSRLGPNVQFTGLERVVAQALFGKPDYVSLSTPSGPDVRLFAAPHNVDSETRVAIVVGRLPNDIIGMLAVFRMVVIYSSLVVLGLTAFGGMFLAERTLKPVERITDIARGIGESDLSRRIDVESEDELGRLAETLNGMIARLEEAFQKQRRFVADASHELRTPLAVIQAESSLVLEKKRPQEDYRTSLELVSQEVDYMSDIVAKLLLLARTDAGSEPIDLHYVNIADLLGELAQDAEALAQEKGVLFRQGPMDSLTVRGDRVKLRQLFLNILDNAIRYTPEGGTVTCSLAGKEGRAIATFTDTGIGIGAEHLPLIFDRFYRVDKARTYAEGGTGLGLSIALSIARMHGGDIQVESREGQGTTFRVELPLADTRTIPWTTPTIKGSKE